MDSEGLWQDYRFLTKEMSNFLQLREMDMFYSLLEQRQDLQALIETKGPDGFLLSAAGRELVREVRQVDTVIALTLRGNMAQLQQKHQVRTAYNPGYQYADMVGRRTDFSG